MEKIFLNDLGFRLIFNIYIARLVHQEEFPLLFWYIFSFKENFEAASYFQKSRRSSVGRISPYDCGFSS